MYVADCLRNKFINFINKEKENKNEGKEQRKAKREELITIRVL